MDDVCIRSGRNDGGFLPESSEDKAGRGASYPMKMFQLLFVSVCSRRTDLLGIKFVPSASMTVNQMLRCKYMRQRKCHSMFVHTIGILCRYHYLKNKVGNQKSYDNVSLPWHLVQDSLVSIVKRKLEHPPSFHICTLTFIIS